VAQKADFEIEMNLTPMIDVTFLLLIFFMLVVKLTQDDLLQLELPKAEKAEEDKSDDADRLIINLSKGEIQAGEKTYDVLIKGITYHIGRKDGIWAYKPGPFYDTIKGAAERAGKDKTIAHASARQVLIRADVDCPYDYIAMVLQALTDVGIYKVQFGAEKVSANEGEL